MKPTGGSVEEFVASVTPAKRQRDALTLIGLYRDVTGMEPALWGTIIGFGGCHYRYPTGTEGDMPLSAFAPRKASSTIYTLDGFDVFADELAALGPHTISKACLYIKDLEQVDLNVLRRIIERSFRSALDDALPGIEITVTDGPE